MEVARDHQESHGPNSKSGQIDVCNFNTRLFDMAEERGFPLADPSSFHRGEPGGNGVCCFTGGSHRLLLRLLPALPFGLAVGFSRNLARTWRPAALRFAG